MFCGKNALRNLSWQAFLSREVVESYFRKQTTNGITEGCQTKIETRESVFCGLKNISVCWRKMLLGSVPSCSYSYGILMWSSRGLSYPSWNRGREETISTEPKEKGTNPWIIDERQSSHHTDTGTAQKQNWGLPNSIVSPPAGLRISFLGRVARTHSRPP
jgi:hypothetical protein